VPPNAPADPQANSYTVELLAALWAAGSGASAAPWSGATIGWLDLDLNPTAPLAGDWSQFVPTVGKTPAIMAFYENDIVFAAGTEAGFTAWGGSDASTMWSYATPAMIKQGQNGGAVMLGSQTPYYGNPCLYAAGSTVPTGTTVAAVNTAGQLVLASNTAFVSGTAANFGHGVLVCNDTGGGGVATQLHTFTYTGTSGSTILTGVVVAGYSGASIATGAACNPAQLQPYTTALPAGAQTGAWPLQWSSTAYTTLSIGASTDWAAAQALNSNGNLNAILDSYVALANTLAANQVPLILRPFIEKDQSGAYWFSQMSWYPSLWKYVVGYITGNGGFSGQPVSPTPAHNVLFCFSQSATSTANVNAASWITNMPAGALVDVLGIDVYNKSSLNTLPSHARAVLNGVTGYRNIPSGLSEFYGQLVSNNTASCYYSGSAIDFSTLVSGNTIQGTVVPGLNSTTTFAASGTLAIATAKGVQTLTYSAVAVAGNTRTFTVSSAAGIPSGSNSLAVSGGMVLVDSTVVAAATCLTDINTSSGVSGNLYPAYFVLWGGSESGLSMLYQASPTALMAGAGVRNAPAIGRPGLLPAMR
jgi:hypothetical protein